VASSSSSTPGPDARPPLTDGLLEALGIARGDVVSVVGAGGKTTLVYRLAAEARAAGWRVLVTTTTHMGTLAEATTGPVLVEAEAAIEEELVRALATEGRATVLGRRVRADKIEGLAPERVDTLAATPGLDLVLVEADGARGRSLKAPAAHEPVIPASTTLVIVVAALDAIGRALDAATVHRVGLVCAATGAAEGTVIDAALVAAALVRPSSYPSRIPAGVRRAVFLNKADDDSALLSAAGIAARLRPAYPRVAAGSARSGRAVVFP
jgi:probable selenium-dependent hydroxylase accessory protein YqeC